MYLYRIETHDSKIDGTGVFAMEEIEKNAIVWKFDPAHDKSISVDEYDLSSKEVRDELDRVAYLSPTTGKYIYPPEHDPARYTNHSKQNYLTVVIDKNISDEPFFIANREIRVGEEITNNYEEFDSALRTRRPDWI